MRRSAFRFGVAQVNPISLRRSAPLTAKRIDSFRSRRRLSFYSRLCFWIGLLLFRKCDPFRFLSVPFSAKKGGTAAFVVPMKQPIFLVAEVGAFFR